jgi:hypothetical protein
MDHHRVNNRNKERNQHNQIIHIKIIWWKVVVYLIMEVVKC